MSRRRPGEHEPGEFHVTFPLSTRWLVGWGTFALCCLPAGAVAFTVVYPRAVPLDTPGPWLLFACMFGPLLLVGLALACAMFRLCFLSGPTRPPVANPTRTDRLLDANDRRERWQARGCFLALGRLFLTGLVLGSPAYSGAPMTPFLWSLVALLFAPLVLHLVVFAVWQPVHPDAACYHCGTWYFAPELRQLTRSGACPHCGYPDPLRGPDDDGEDDEAVEVPRARGRG